MKANRSKKMGDFQPLIIVVSVKRPQAYPRAGRASSAARSGRDQNSPIKQWKVRSLKYSLLLAKASMRMI